MYRSLTQRGDRVVVTAGPYAGQEGEVTGVRLVRNGDIHRETAVLLDATRDVGVRLRHFGDGLLRILD